MISPMKVTAPWLTPACFAADRAWADLALRASGQLLASAEAGPALLAGAGDVSLALAGDVSGYSAHVNGTAFLGRPMNDEQTDRIDDGGALGPHCAWSEPVRP
ncbi:MAG: hypothetical protein QM207_16165 [Thermobispora sp.]|nr:hypothetical protein [Thermobispora sp.]